MKLNLSRNTLVILSLISAIIVIIAVSVNYLQNEDTNTKIEIPKDTVILTISTNQSEVHYRSYVWITFTLTNTFDHPVKVITLNGTPANIVISSVEGDFIYSPSYLMGMAIYGPNDLVEIPSYGKISRTESFYADNPNFPYYGKYNVTCTHPFPGNTGTINETFWNNIDISNILQIAII